MNERENDEAVVSKKFKPSNENNEQTTIGQNKNEVIISKRKAEKEAGSYFLGPTVKKYVRAPVTQCLVRKKRTDDYYLMKILDLDENISERYSVMKRTIFHNEYSLLSLLKGQPGIIQLQDFFKEYVYDENQSRQLRRVCMVLECVIPHGHYNTEFIPLNHYLREDRISETEALHIFYNLLWVLKELHKKNVVHRDIRLSNIIINRRSLRVTMIDFYYAKLLQSDAVAKCHQCKNYPNDFLGAQQISPKANDMWSAGIILYAMLNGCMPFAGASNYVSFFSANRSLHEFYLKIMENDCTITNNICISDGTKEILKSILCKVPQCRLTASEAMDMVSSVLAVHYSSHNPGLNEFADKTDQLVPDIPGSDDGKVEEEPTSKSDSSDCILIKSEVTQPEEEEVNKPPVRVESVIKRVSDYQRATVPSKAPQQNPGLTSRDIRYAMFRLGVTCFNSINALSFTYNRRTY